MLIMIGWKIKPVLAGFARHPHFMWSIQSGRGLYCRKSRASDVPSNLGTSQISIPFVGIVVKGPLR